MNSVKVYSNGTAVISKDYPLSGEEPVKISIPVRKSDLDEVVASIAVFGNVSVPEMSYSPVNAEATKLEISPTAAFKDTMTKLTGSSIDIQRTSGSNVTGRLVGVHSFEETNANGMTTERLKVVVSTANGVTMIQEDHIASVRFTEEAVQREYDKALASMYQKIKPGSSFVDLVLVPAKGEKRATISYATPIAAWKPCYQLRSTNGIWELQSQAVVDNDTDDDWKAAVISVITGEPIAFETDLAEIRRPVRSRVNVVSDTAQGAVGVQETIGRKVTNAKMMMGFAPSNSISPSVRFPGDDASLMQLADGSSNIDVYDEGYESVSMGAPPREQARQAQAEVRESGDFSIFTAANPIDIGSKKSSVIPMFRSFLDVAKTVLVYNEKHDARRPFRAIKFKNETKNPLGKGVCEIFVDSDFQGKCILEATRPGEDAFLVHAKETGVKIFKQQSPVENRRTSIRIKDGVVQNEQASRTEATYTITNSKPEAFDVEIEHARHLAHSTASFRSSDCDLVGAETPTGWRVSLTLPAGAEVVVTVAESSIHQSAYNLHHNNGPMWLQQNIIALKNPLSRNNGIRKVIELQEKVEDIRNAIHKAEDRIQVLREEQENLLKLIPSGHAEQANQWKTELGENKNELRTLQRDTMPALQAEMRDAVKNVQAGLDEIVANWSEKKNEEVGVARAEEGR